MRKLLSTFIGIFIVILLAAIVVGVIGWLRMPDFLANKLSEKLNVAVNVEDVDLGWREISIDQVVIGNPPGSLLSKAFSCRTIQIFAPFFHYLKPEVIIDQVEVDNIYLGLEFDSATGVTGNWTRLMANLEKSMGKPSSKTSSQEKKRSLLIRRLILTNIDVDVVYRKEGGKIQRLKRIDRIELNNISSEGGLPVDQLMNSVLGEMLKSVFEKQNLKNMLQNLLQQPGNKIQKFLEPFQGLLNRSTEEAIYEETSPFYLMG